MDLKLLVFQFLHYLLMTVWSIYCPCSTCTNKLEIGSQMRCLNYFHCDCDYCLCSFKSFLIFFNEISNEIFLRGPIFFCWTVQNYGYLINNVINSPCRLFYFYTKKRSLKQGLTSFCLVFFLSAVKKKKVTRAPWQEKKSVCSLHVKFYKN